MQYNVRSAVVFKNTPPEVHCPAADTVQLQPSECEKNMYQYSVNASDDAPGWVLEQLEGLPSGANLPVGRTVNVFRVTDAEGNTATCSFSVEVQHFKAVMDCRNFTQLPVDEHCSLSASKIVQSVLQHAPVLGCASQYKLEIFRAGSFVLFDSTTIELHRTLNFRVTDQQYNGQCGGVFEMVDKAPPKLQCTDFQTFAFVRNVEPSILRDSGGITVAIPLLQDNCSAVNILTKIDHLESKNCSSNISSIIRRVWRATDESGNTSTCLQIITQLRPPLGDLRTPDDITLTNCEMPDLSTKNTGEPFVLLQNLKLPPNGSFANTFTDSDTVSCNGSRHLLRRWDLFDWCTGELQRRTQHIYIADQAPPTVHCPDTLVWCAPQASVSSCYALARLPDILLEDNCSNTFNLQATWGGGGVAEANFPADNLSKKWASFDTLPLPLGQHTVQLLAADHCGNSHTCQLQIFVPDAVPPTPFCVPLVVLSLDRTNTATLFASACNAGSFDNCSDVLGFKIKRNDHPDDWFADSAAFDCSDIGDTVLLTVRVYDFLPATGGVPDHFGGQQFSECSVTVMVEDDGLPQCVAPPDITLTCHDYDIALPQLSLQDFTMNCAAAAQFSFENDYSLFDEKCHSGTIVQKLTINPQLACWRNIHFMHDPDGLAGFAVKFPDDISGEFCTVLDVPYTPPTFFGPICGEYKISYSDIFQNSRIIRTWKVYHPCLLLDPLPPNYHFTNIYNPPGTEVGVVSAGPTAPPPFIPTPTTWERVLLGASYYQDIVLNPTNYPFQLNGCEAASKVFYDTTTNDPLLWQHAAFHEPLLNTPDLPEMPVSFSTVLDHCDPRRSELRFILSLDLDHNGTRETVIDNGKPPSTPGMVSVGNSNWVPFDLRPVPDNHKYQFAIRWDSLAPQRFRANLMWNTPAQPHVFVTPQLPYGSHTIEWRVYNPLKNAQRTCKTNFTVVPVAPVRFSVGGKIQTEENRSLYAAQLQLRTDSLPLSPTQIFYQTTDSTGNFFFSESVPSGSGYLLTPSHSALPLNGVTTFDILLISRHILGLQPLTSPYKLLAADANFSNSITANDIVTLRKLILGIDTIFKNNASWIFVPSTFVFPNPTNPFLMGATGSSGWIRRTNVQDDFLNENFVAIKMGDLNANANPQQNLASPPDDRHATQSIWTLPDQRLVADQIFSMPIHPPAEAVAWQMTLEFQDLQLLDIEGLPDEAVAVFSDENCLTFSVFGEKTASQPFFLKWKAGVSGNLSERIFSSDRRTPRELVLRDGSVWMPVLQFENSADSEASNHHLRGWSAVPQPFVEQTTLRVSVPRAGNLLVQVWDALGRLVIAKKHPVEQGWQVLPLDFSEVAARGVFVARLQLDGDEAVEMKLLRI